MLRECREQDQHHRHGNLAYVWPQSCVNLVILIIRTGFRLSGWHWWRGCFTDRFYR